MGVPRARCDMEYTLKVGGISVFLVIFGINTISNIIGSLLRDTEKPTYFGIGQYYVLQLQPKLYN